MRNDFKGKLALTTVCMILYTASSVTGSALAAETSVPNGISGTPAGGNTAVETPATEAPEVKQGWETDAKGRTCYYKNGKKVTGLKKIGSKTYYFKPSNGAMLRKSWKTFKNGKSYFDSDGVRVTGLKKIGKKYYYFNKKGILQTSTKKVGKNTYYPNKKGVLQNWKIGNRYYNASGKKMGSVAVKEFKTLQRAKAIAAKITTSKMTKQQKLKKCFDWVISKYYVTRTQGFNYPGWTADHANDHFIYGSGNCFADASAFAYLAKAIGYDPVYVCTDSKGRGAHGWCEINGRVYDPLFSEAKNYYKYYGGSYSSFYTQHPALRVKI